MAKKEKTPIELGLEEISSTLPIFNNGLGMLAASSFAKLQKQTEISFAGLRGCMVFLSIGSSIV